MIAAGRPGIRNNVATSTTFTDNFNRADGLIGSPWTLFVLGGTTIDSGTIETKVVTNRARVTGSAIRSSTRFPQGAYLDVGKADVDITVTWSAVASSSTANGVMLRGDSAGPDSFFFARPNELSYQTSTTGSSTIVSYSATFGAGDVMRITITGREFRIYRNGTLVGSRGAGSADTLPNLTATRFGLVGDGFFDTSTAWDDFSITY